MNRRSFMQALAAFAIVPQIIGRAFASFWDDDTAEVQAALDRAASRGEVWCPGSRVWRVRGPIDMRGPGIGA